LNANERTHVIAEIKKRFVISCALDWVPLPVLEGEIQLWEVANDPGDATQLVLDLVRDLVASRLVAIGTLDLESPEHEFCQWSTDIDGAIARIVEAWDERFKREIAWFCATSTGAHEALVFARQLGLESLYDRLARIESNLREDTGVP